VPLQEQFAKGRSRTAGRGVLSAVDRADVVGELVRKSEDDLLAVKNFGQKSLDEIKEKLKEMGLDLGMKID